MLRIALLIVALAAGGAAAWVAFNMGGEPVPGATITEPATPVAAARCACRRGRSRAWPDAHQGQHALASMARKRTHSRLHRPICAAKRAGNVGQLVGARSHERGRANSHRKPRSRQCRFSFDTAPARQARGRCPDFGREQRGRLCSAERPGRRTADSRFRGQGRALHQHDSEEYPSARDRPDRRRQEQGREGRKGR